MQGSLAGFLGTRSSLLPLAVFAILLTVTAWVYSLNGLRHGHFSFAAKGKKSRSVKKKTAGYYELFWLAVSALLTFAMARLLYLFFFMPELLA